MNAVTAKNSPIEFIKLLNSRGINVLYGTESKNVQQGIKYHTDLQLAHAGNNTYVCAPECFDYYENIFKKTNLKLYKGETELGYTYPDDCAYNVATLKNYAIGNFDVCDGVLKRLLVENSYKLINVKQAYAKCSICIVGDNALITSDEGINKALLHTKIDVLKIDVGDIKLAGFNYGFIGGCSGYTDENIYFCGDITCHRDWLKIKAFCKKHNKEILYSKNYLEDVGTIFFLA